MIDENWLSDVMFTTVSINADLARVKSSTNGDFQTAALSKAVSTPENNEATYIAWRERAAERKSTLIFCVDVRHIHELTATFRHHGVDAKFVTFACDDVGSKPVGGGCSPSFFINLCLSPAFSGKHLFHLPERLKYCYENFTRNSIYHSFSTRSSSHAFHRQVSNSSDSRDTCSFLWLSPGTIASTSRC